MPWDVALSTCKVDDPVLWDVKFGAISVEGESEEKAPEQL